MVIDLKHEKRQGTDIEFVASLLGALVGQRCLKFELSYGGELNLHIGDPIAGPMADETSGSWILGTRASWWQLLINQSGLLVQSGPVPESISQASHLRQAGEILPSETTEAHAEVLSGAMILRVEPVVHREGVRPGIGLLVVLEDHSRLLVAPSNEPDEAEDPLADWELFTPFNMYLRVGPDLLWCYLRSDIAAEGGGSFGSK